MRPLRLIVQPVLIEPKEMLQVRPVEQQVARSKGHSLEPSSATAVNPQDVGQCWGVLLAVPGSRTRETIFTGASTMTACAATNQERITKDYLMSKLNHRHIFDALALAMLFCVSGTVFAENSMQKEKVVSINEYTCEQLISATSHDRAAAIAFLHGYSAGMAGAKTVDTEKLGITSDRLVVHCLDNRTDTAVVALDKVSKSLKN
jgi:hypothetical protein